jgi:acetyl-CoA carboxylase biotin carboxylase subunit
MFKKILIANRGEIAIRIIQAAKSLDIKTIAVYHKVDKEMPFVLEADFAVELKADTPKNAYLDMQQIITVAKNFEAEAIHPGYGFLSENAKFSQLCEDNSIIFIGPKAHSIEVMGSKTGARELMAKSNVPIVPGHNDRVDDIEKAKEIARNIGYPIMLKAAAGGGGKGMRLVEIEDDFQDSYEAAQREAMKAFGDDLVYMEKYIVAPKHIEIQIICDKHGNAVYLGERDCSIQRRHQKVIEEAPSTVLDEQLRAKMGEVAINAAKACGYINAGTIEFLVDINKNFYFLEMNTRLQVEHPVTELVTNIDLAREQIKVAYGLPLSFSQEDIKIEGHAIEVRIYSEDPLNNFMPELGNLDYHKVPIGNGVRVDGGVETNSVISMHFDPMISKLITYGTNRHEAIDKMITALEQYKIVGINNVIPFLIDVMKNDTFRSGYFDTGFIGKVYDFENLKLQKRDLEEIVALISAYEHIKSNEKIKVDENAPNYNGWKLNNLAVRSLN